MGEIVRPFYLPVVFLGPAEDSGNLIQETGKHQLSESQDGGVRTGDFLGTEIRL